MTSRTQYPVRGEGAKSREVQVNEVLTHPLTSSERGTSRDRWRYHFLRVTRYPTPDRPDSGRILVENAASGKRTEHYAFLFNVKFKSA